MIEKHTILLIVSGIYIVVGILYKTVEIITGKDLTQKIIEAYVGAILWITVIIMLEVVR